MLLTAILCSLHLNRAKYEQLCLGPHITNASMSMGQTLSINIACQYCNNYAIIVPLFVEITFCSHQWKHQSHTRFHITSNHVCGCQLFLSCYIKNICKLVFPYSRLTAACRNAHYLAQDSCTPLASQHEVSPWSIQHTQGVNNNPFTASGHGLCFADLLLIQSQRSPAVKGRQTPSGLSKRYWVLTSRAAAGAHEHPCLLQLGGVQSAVKGLPNVWHVAS